MKRLVLFLCIFSVFVFSGCTNQETNLSTLEKIRKEGKVKVGVKVDSKPFGYEQNGELKGYDIDLAYLVAKKVTKKLDPEVEFVKLASNDRIFALNSGDVDMIIATMSITPQRNILVNFSRPYYVAGQALMVKNGSKIKDISDLGAKTTGIVLNSTGEGTLIRLVPDTRIKGAKTYTEAFSLLKKGEIDALLADDTILYGLSDGSKKYTILPRRYTKEYYAIAVRKEDKDLQNVLDRSIRLLGDSGELNLLKKKWLK